MTMTSPFHLRPSGLRSSLRTAGTLALATLCGTALAAPVTATLDDTSFTYSLAFPATGPARITTEGPDAFYALGSFTVPIPGGMFPAVGDAGPWRVVRVETTLRMEDGDTGPGDFDFDRLVPTLSKGAVSITLPMLKLNGFTNEASVTATNFADISGDVSLGLSLAQMLALDGESVGFGITDLAEAGNNIYFYKSQAGVFDLKFDLVAVPLPATLPMLAAGLGALAAFRRRNRR
jgi:hypothetical protein